MLLGILGIIGIHGFAGYQYGNRKAKKWEAIYAEKTREGIAGFNNSGSNKIKYKMSWVVPDSCLVNIHFLNLRGMDVHSKTILGVREDIMQFPPHKKGMFWKIEGKKNGLDKIELNHNRAGLFISVPSDRLRTITTIDESGLSQKSIDILNKLSDNTKIKFRSDVSEVEVLLNGKTEAERKNEARSKGISIGLVEGAVVAAVVFCIHSTAKTLFARK